MPLFAVQCLAAVLALFISIQGLSEVEQGSMVGILKTLACPLLWMYLARKLKSFYPSAFFLVGGIFIAVVMVPGIVFPALTRQGDTVFSLLAFAAFLVLNLWSAYHARWAQTELFKKTPAVWLPDKVRALNQASASMKSSQSFSQSAPLPSNRPPEKEALDAIYACLSV
jgi:hypothetical protein